MENVTDIIQAVQILEQKETIIKTLEQTISTSNIILIIAGGIIIIIAILFYIEKTKERKNYNKQEKQIKELIRQLQEIETRTTQDEQGRTIRIKRIYLDDLPETIKEDIKEKTNIFRKLFIDKKESEEPYLILMKNDKTIEIRKKAKEGTIEIKDEKGETTKKIILSAQKLHKIKLGKEKVHAWIASEDEAESYPIEVQHYSKTFHEIIQSMLLNKGNLMPTKKGIPKWLIIIIPILIIIGIIAWYAMNQLNPTTTINTINTTINTTTQIIQNNVTSITPIDIVKIG